MLHLNADIIFYELSQLFVCSKYGNSVGFTTISYPAMFSPSKTPIHREVLYVCDAIELSDNCVTGAFVCSGKLNFTESGQGHCIICVHDVAKEVLFHSLIEIFEKYNDWDEGLRNSLNEENPLINMVNCSKDIFVNPICVSDPDFRLIVPLYESTDKYHEAKLYPPDQDGFIPPEHMNYLKNDPYYFELHNIIGVFSYKSKLLPYSWLGINFFRKNDSYYIARLLVFEAKIKFRPIDSFLLQHLAKYMQPCFSLSASQLVPDNKGFHSYVLSLLEGEKMKPLTDSSLSPTNWSSNDSFLWLHVLQSEKDITNKTIHYICIKIEKLFSQCYAVKWERGISILANITASKHTYDTFIKKFEDFVSENGYQVGISNCFKSTKNLADLHTQATIAAITGRAIHPEKYLFKFVDYAVTHFLKNGVIANTSMDYCHPVVQRLAEYDANNNTDYIKTIQIYLENQMGILATAQELSIHRSTMIYRLKRINELTEVDWDNRDEIFYIIFSLKLISLGLIIK